MPSKEKKVKIHKEDLTAKINRIDRNLSTLVENLPLLKKVASEVDIKKEIDEREARVAASAKAFIEKMEKKQRNQEEET